MTTNNASEARRDMTFSWGGGFWGVIWGAGEMAAKSPVSGGDDIVNLKCRSAPRVKSEERQIHLSKASACRSGSIATRILAVIAENGSGVSCFFAMGLPFGAFWIPEHSSSEAGQETYSYYGRLNLLRFNRGYHTEHHDFPSIPWNRLPRLRHMAPEWYDGVRSHRN